MSDLKFIFCTNFYDNVSNGPAKFARIITKFGGENVLIITEDAIFNSNSIRSVPRPATWAKTSLLTQGYRNLAFAQGLSHLPLVGKEPIVFNNIINTFMVRSRFTNPIIGFINDDNNLPSRLSGQYSLASMQRRILGKMERAAAKRVDGVVVNSRYLAEKVTREYELSPDKVHLLYKGTNLKDINFRPRTPSSSGPINILFVKSDFRRGGLLELMEAIRFIDRVVHLHVIGPTQKAIEVATGRLVKSIENLNVHCHGKQPPEFVNARLMKTDIACLPSHFEALGVFNMEAMAHGVPVVTSGVGGIPEVTDGGKNCWEVDPSDPYSIAEGITATWTRRDETMIKVSNARDYITAHFSEDHAFRRLEEIIQLVKSNVRFE